MLIGGAVGVGVGVVGGCAQYLPPVFTRPLPPCPPHTTISLPVQTPANWFRAVGAFVVLVAVQLSVSGLYLPPLFE